MARIISANPWGIDARSIDIEVDVGVDVAPREIRISGLPDGAARESGLRVQSALRSSGCELPPRRVTVRLEPLDFPKEAAHFDFPIAIALLSALGHIPETSLEGRLVYGELGLDGSVRPVRGSLAIARLAALDAIREVLVPAACAGEAASTGSVRVIPVSTLLEAVGHLSERAPLAVFAMPAPPAEPAGVKMPDLSEIHGQEASKRALEVAAAGGHHLLLIGPPGSGKTMLARRLPGILPPLSREESIEVTKIQSLVAETPQVRLASRRPFRSPHPTVSTAGMIGGGKVARPGEASLAHAGVLFLDELTEFRRETLHALCQALDQGQTTVLRPRAPFDFPARFALVAAMEPCPCGHYDDPRHVCRCAPSLIDRYRSRIPRSCLDAFDLFISVPPIVPRDLRPRPSEPSAHVAARVREARLAQQQRFAGHSSGLAVNAAIGPEDLGRYCTPDDDARSLLHALRTTLRLPTSAVARILRVARTLADMDRSDSIRNPHLAEAVSLARGWETTR